MCPARTTVTRAGAAAAQPLTVTPAQRWARSRALSWGSDEMWWPSIATIRSPGWSTPLAPLPAVTELTARVSSAITVCCDGARLPIATSPSTLPDISTAVNSAKAVSRFTPGPARITTMRFHGAFM